jgi:hypothetical protein
MQYVFGEYGIDLPRRAISQSRVGDPAGRRLQRGDLLFFADDGRRSQVTHVGIYEGGGMMIDASRRFGKVRRGSLDDDYLIERFMFARRVTDGGDIEEIGRREPEARRPRGDRRKTAARILEGLAGIFLRRPNR